jgi:integrase
MAGRDTKTKYQGVYARHQESCARTAELELPEEKRGKARCDCKPSYFGVAWDKATGKTRKTRHYPKAIEARNARADLAASLRMGRPVGTSALRFDAAITKFVGAAKDGTALNKNGQTYTDEAANDLRLTLGHLPDQWSGRRVDDISGGDVQVAIDEWLGQDPPLSGSRIRSRVYALSSLYRYLRQRELSSADPTPTVQLPALDSAPRDRVATPAEFASLLAVLEGAEVAPLALAAYSAARAAEIRQLDWIQVDFDKEIMLLSEGRGKSRAATRIVPIVRPLLVVLKAEWLRQGRPKSGKVCPPLRASRSGELATGPYLRRCREAWDEANKAERGEARKGGREPNLLTPINLQECRHTCATWLDHAGVSPKVNSQWMGHSTPERQPGAAPITLNRYTHVLAGEMEKAREQLDSFLAERARLRGVR